ncbi:hypothetical protein [uncultured Mediterranean phage]|nr:hypothetical protein [uncultured Mediterranean phage]
MSSPFPRIQSDRAISNIVWQTVEIDNSGASGDYTIHATPAGVRFICPHIYLHSEGAIAATFKSGSTNISGPISIAAEEVMEVLNDGFGVFHGRLSGEDFVVNVSAAQQINGFAVIGEL